MKGAVLMAYIYKITNKENGKEYVGKTEHSDPRNRFKEHLQESRQKRSKERPLYRAINKYGEDNFQFTVLEEVTSEEASNREKYWVKKLGTYGSVGYNATKGGDGSIYLDYQKIIEDYRLIGEQREVARINNCHEDSVKLILEKFNIPIITSDEILATKYAKGVEMLNKSTQEVIETFPSQIAAARYLIDNGYSNTKSAGSLSSKISLVVRGKRASCAGFKWRSL